jgi:CRISPR-associated protein Cas1
MSEEHVLVIENPAHLSVDLGRLRLRRDGFDDVFFLPTDIACVVLHHDSITVSHHALRILADAGSALLATDQYHMPSGIFLSADGNRLSSSRLWSQIKLHDSPMADELWRQVVVSRLLTQAANLRDLEMNGALKLERFAESVVPGDISNVEGQGAKHYWSTIFTDFTREKRGASDGLNARLNYGYAIIRSLVARELVARGLTPELGLGHRNHANSFNLADDFMEPYRYVVERFVCTQDPDAEFVGPEKIALLGLLKCVVPIRGRDFRITNAIAETVMSFARVLESGSGDLLLPAGWPEGGFDGG